MNIAALTSGGSSTSVSGARLAENFDTFLLLLTTQLQNQDPLQPMDSNEFTNQLVQFAGVEQQIAQNQNLERLIALQGAALGETAVSYLGRDVTLRDGRSALEAGTAEWSYALGAGSAQTQLTVSDARGRVVFTGAGERAAGIHTVEWNGRDNAGFALSDGVYTLAVTAFDANGNRIQTQVESRHTVRAVDVSGGTPLLVLGPLSVGLDEIAAVAPPRT